VFLFIQKCKVKNIAFKFFIRLRDNSVGGEVFKCVLCREVFSKEFERERVESEKSKDKRLRFKLDFFYKHLACYHRDELVKIGVDEIPQDRDCRNRLVKFFQEEGWKGDEKVIEELKKIKEIKTPSLKRKRETSEGGRVEKVLFSTCAPCPSSSSSTSTSTPSTPSTSTTPSTFIAPDAAAAAASSSIVDDDSSFFSTCSSFSTSMVDFISSPSSSSLVSSSFSSASTSSSSFSTTSQDVEEIESISSSPCFDFEEAIRFLPYPSENAPSASRKGGKKSLEVSLEESYGVHYVPKALDFSSVLNIKKRLFNKYISQVLSFRY